MPSGRYVQWLLGLKVVVQVKFLSKQLNDFTKLVAESRVVFYRSPWGCFLSVIILPYYRALRPSHCVRKYSVDFKRQFRASILTSFVPFVSLTCVVQQNQMQVGILLWFQNKDSVAISWRSWLCLSSCNTGVCFWPGRLLECSTGDDTVITGINLCSWVRAVPSTYTLLVILHTCISWHLYLTSLIGVNDDSVITVVTRYAWRIEKSVNGTISAGSLKRRGHLRDLGIDGRISLKLI